MARKKHPARLYVILARAAPVAVVFRRGPSRQVRLIKWNTVNDTFEAGQWFKGRIYERRCDLSPNGNLLIYFAATHKKPWINWTAISRPPYFTALALWPKIDCWHGGGWFLSDTEIKLNHGESERTLHPDFRPGPIVVNAEDDGLGGLEDKSVWTPVRIRDGWVRTQESTAIEQRGLLSGWCCDPPEVWAKEHLHQKGVFLRMEILGIGHKESAWYQIRYQVTFSPQAVTDLGICDWADWDSERGDILFAKDGCLYRQSLVGRQLLAPVMLADFNDQTFCEVPPSELARRWA